MTNIQTNAISIDPVHARELDDAIAARVNKDGSWHVDVLIPDVPSVVPRGSHMDVAALEAGMTSYDAGGIRKPMLPIEMIERLSLSPDQDRPVIHIQINVARDLTSSVLGINTGTGRTAAALSYKKADNILDEPGHEHHSQLATLWDLAKRLTKERAAAIGAKFDDSGKSWIDEEGQTVTFDDNRTHRSNIMVMELMVLTNAALAQHARKTGRPVLYRNHRIDGFESGKMSEAAKELAAQKRIGHHTALELLLTMSNKVGQAFISETPCGHHGLDLEAYGWFTSPLRRYCDLVSLRALTTNETEPNLQEVAQSLTELHRAQSKQSNGHHAKRSRKDLIDLITREDHDRLNCAHLHTILRSIAENDHVDMDKANNHVLKRMDEDNLSGKDIHALHDYADSISPSLKPSLDIWMSQNKARDILLEKYRKSIDGEPASKTKVKKHKAMLHEMAQIHEAQLTFGLPYRTGMAHEPIFTVEARWEKDGKIVDGQGIATTIKNAEHLAAHHIISQLDLDENVTPPKPAQQEQSPKSRLYELATASKAAVKFNEPSRTGPHHLPIFTVEVCYTDESLVLKARGSGTSKKEAERVASVNMLELIRTSET